MILVGLFFAPHFYRLNLLRVGDFYRLRYNRVVEVLCAVCIAASYLEWVAAQFKVFGLVLNVMTDGAVSQPVGMVIGAVIVPAYTTVCGMFSVAILDFVQISVIMGGLLSIASVVSGLAGDVDMVISHAAQAGKLNVFPQATFEAWVPFIGAWVTMMLGAIPQQDVFNVSPQPRTNARPCEDRCWAAPSTARLLTATMGMVAGSFLQQKIGTRHV